MIDPIARYIVKCKKPIKISESSKRLYEKDADEEYSGLNSDGPEHDDSQAPIQGKPDEEPDNDSDTEEEEVHDFDVPKPHNMRKGSGVDLPEEPEDDISMEEPEDDASGETSDTVEYDNPLDNQYAVHFTLDDEVSLIFKGLKTSEKKSGKIDGYDTEGFYKVKWSDGSTTSGLTDIALESLVSKKTTTDSSVIECVCGHTEYVVENNICVCDYCGRVLEGIDPLTLADRSRPKGKRMIRSEAHPISTASKPDIAISESDEVSVFDRLKSLDNQFWTRSNELVDDIESLGYEVEEINSEYVIVSSTDSEDDVCRIPIEGTSRTMYLNIDRMRLI